VGFEISDTLALAAQVYCAKGVFRFAVVLVCELVLCAGAVGGTSIGVDTMRLLYLMTCLGLTSNYAVGGRTPGTGACILVTVCITGVLLVMDIVVRMFVDASLVSTLGTGYTLRAVI
jgi:hypothetical protein